MILRGVIFNYEEHEILTNVMARSEKGKEFKWIYFDTTRPETHPGFWCKTRMPVHVSRHWLMLEKQNLNKHLLRYSPQPRRWLWEHRHSCMNDYEINFQKEWSDGMHVRRERESERRDQVLRQNIEDEKMIESLSEIEMSRWRSLLSNSKTSPDHDVLPKGWICRHVRYPKCYYVNLCTNETRWKRPNCSGNVWRRVWLDRGDDSDDEEVLEEEEEEEEDKEMEDKDMMTSMNKEEEEEESPEVLKEIARRARHLWETAKTRAKRRKWDVLPGQIRHLRLNYKRAKRRYFQAIGKCKPRRVEIRHVVEKTNTNHVKKKERKEKKSREEEKKIEESSSSSSDEEEEKTNLSNNVLVTKLKQYLQSNLQLIDQNDEQEKIECWQGSLETICDQIQNQQDKDEIDKEEFLNTVKKLLVWCPSRESEIREIAEREARRSFKDYVKTSEAREEIRKIHDRMKSWRSGEHIQGFWNLVKGLGQPIIARDTVHTTRCALSTSFIHNLFDEDVVARYQSGCMLSYFDVCTLLKDLEESGYDLGHDVRHSSTTWAKLGGSEILVDMTELTESETSRTGRMKSTQPFTGSRLFRCVGTVKSSREEIEVNEKRKKEEVDESTVPISQDESVSEEIHEACRQAVSVSKRAVNDMHLVVNPVLALVASISASRASEYAARMAHFQIVRASSIRAFKVAKEASVYV